MIESNCRISKIRLKKGGNMKSKFGLTDEQKQKIADQLGVLLASNYGLYFNTLNAHWNMEDSRFLFLHEMLEEQYKSLADAGDEIAERIRQMGHKAPGSFKKLAESNSFTDLSEEASADQMLTHLAECHEAAIQKCREISVLGEECGDFGLVDMLGGLLRDHEKTAWMLRSHL